MGSFKKPFKEEIVTPYQAESGPYEELYVAKLRQDALDHLTINLLQSSAGQPDDDTVQGIYSLFQMQSLIMAGIVNGIAGWADERREAARAEAAETNRVADDVRRVREAFIGEAAKAGAETAVIAQALNMKRSAIERVVAQLQGGASPQPAAASA